MATQTLKITGMHCVDCAHKVEAALQTVPGVATAKVHYLKRQAQVAFTTESTDPALLIAAVQAAGYDATAG
jgi:copper chaperone CopZ